MTAPAHQICPLCVHDDDIEKTVVGDEWIFTCSNRSHAPLEWRPKEQFQASLSYRTGIGEELGVYDTLLSCVVDGFAEYGVIEHRFSEADNRTYRELVRRYGHTAQGPRKYSVSSFLGGALGALWREALVEGKWGPATGYWSYNSQVGCYAPVGTPEDAPVLSWAEFATEGLGAGVRDWPALGYVDP